MPSRDASSSANLEAFQEFRERKTIPPPSVMVALWASVIGGHRAADAGLRHCFEIAGDGRLVGGIRPVPERREAVVTGDSGSVLRAGSAADRGPVREVAIRRQCRRSFIDVGSACNSPFS